MTSNHEIGGGELPPPPPAPEDGAWTLSTIENLKRSVTNRALTLITAAPSQRRSLNDLRRLYRLLDEIHTEYCVAYGIGSRSELPRWVQGIE